jgi:mono/diheme cytochrome c family protein
MTGRRWQRIVLPALLVVGSACADDDDETAVSDTTGGDGMTPGQVAAIEAHPDGHETFQQRCAACHGTDLAGTGGGPSLRSIVYEPGHHSDDAFRRAVTSGSPQHHWGFGDMPPMGQGLSDEVIDEIVAYVRVVQEEDGFEE